MTRANSATRAGTVPRNQRDSFWLQSRHSPPWKIQPAMQAQSLPELPWLIRPDRLHPQLTLYQLLLLLWTIPRISWTILPLLWTNPQLRQTILHLWAFLLMLSINIRRLQTVLHLQWTYPQHWWRIIPLLWTMHIPLWIQKMLEKEDFYHLCAISPTIHLHQMKTLLQLLWITSLSLWTTPVTTHGALLPRVCPRDTSGEKKFQFSGFQKFPD